MSSKLKVQCQNKSETESHVSCVCIVGSCVLYENQKGSKAYKAECSTPITALIYMTSAFLFFLYKLNNHTYERLTNSRKKACGCMYYVKFTHNQ